MRFAREGAYLSVRLPAVGGTPQTAVGPYQDHVRGTGRIDGNVQHRARTNERHERRPRVTAIGTLDHAPGERWHGVMEIAEPDVQRLRVASEGHVPAAGCGLAVTQWKPTRVGLAERPRLPQPAASGQ